MKVAVMEDIGKMNLVERPIPKPQKNEVLVSWNMLGYVGQTYITMNMDA